VKIAISNSSPLIILSTINSLNLIFNLFDEVYITPAVYEEVVIQGIAEHYHDAHLIASEIKNKKIIIKNPEIGEHNIDFSNIHPGESESILLALSLRGSNSILLDDEEARLYARNLGLRVKGTLGILIENYKKSFINSRAAVNILNKINQLLYLSADLYSRVLSEIT